MIFPFFLCVACLASWFGHVCPTNPYSSMRCNGLLVALFCTGSEMCMCHGVSHHACCMSPIRILGHGIWFNFSIVYSKVSICIYMLMMMFYRHRVESESRKF